MAFGKQRIFCTIWSTFLSNVFVSVKTNNAGMYANVICSSNVSILTSLTWLDYQVGLHTWKSVCLSKLWITVAKIATQEAIKVLPHMSANCFMHKSHGLLGLRNIVLVAFQCAEDWGHDNLNHWNVVLFIHTYGTQHTSSECKCPNIWQCSVIGQRSAEYSFSWFISMAS